MKLCIMAGLILLTKLCAPAVVTVGTDWQQQDPGDDHVFGISTNKAYKELLTGKKSTRLIVAVIDSGTDTAHADLKDVLWINEKEIPGNAIDDDHNGYIDDIHGWNFIGTESGREDLVHLILPEKAYYDSLAAAGIPAAEREGYRQYRRIWDEYLEHVSNAKAFLSELESNEETLNNILQDMGVRNPTPQQLKAYTPKNAVEEQILKQTVQRLSKYKDFAQMKKRETEEMATNLSLHLRTGLKLQPAAAFTALSPRSVRGNSDVQYDPLGLIAHPNISPYHGTHVAGIVAASRNNGTGMNGIADNVRIMTLKLMSNIRELRDENLALAIRYAVDNGARVINLSFGKPFSFRKKEVDAAVQYAMQKDVLIVHAAGNVGENLDATDHYPNPIYADSTGLAKAWIEVGASGPRDDSTLAWAYSNYGQKSVDVFAPGVQIYSCWPDEPKFVSADGTSMAAPVVSGLAALIREYYPELSATQVKEIIVQSVIKRPVLADKCVTGGVVNAYNALKLAATYK